MRLADRGAWVEIETVGGVFVVTGCSGYVARLPACHFDLCESGQLKPCVRPLNVRSQHSVDGKMSVDAWLEHIKTNCHRWHPETVEAFARRVLDTYGKVIA